MLIAEAAYLAAEAPRPSESTYYSKCNDALQNT